MACVPTLPIARNQYDTPDLSAIDYIFRRPRAQPTRFTYSKSSGLLLMPFLGGAIQ